MILRWFRHSWRTSGPRGNRQGIGYPFRSFNDHVQPILNTKSTGPLNLINVHLPAMRPDFFQKNGPNVVDSAMTTAPCGLAGLGHGFVREQGGARNH